MQIIIRPVPVTFFHVHSLRNFPLSVPINVQTWWELHGPCEIPVIILPPTRIINSSFRVRFPFACCLLFFVINSIKWETRLSWRGIITLFYSSLRLRTIHMYFYVSLWSDTLKRRGRYETFFMVYITMCRVKWSSVEFDELNLMQLANVWIHSTFYERISRLSISNEDQMDTWWILEMNFEITLESKYQHIWV